MVTKTVTLSKERVEWSGCDSSFTLRVKHYEDGGLMIGRNECYFSREVDGHYVMVLDRKCVGPYRGNLPNNSYEILGVRHDKQEAEDYCLGKARKTARNIARSLDVEVGEFGLEEVAAQTV